jgi:Na+/H+-dicarboxylate symporter
MERFFGGNPGLVILRLMIISVIVGVLLSALGLDPRDIIDSFVRLLQRIYDMGFEAIEWALRYFLLGAVIVFPIWLVSRIVKLMGRSGSSLNRNSRRSDV